MYQQESDRTIPSIMKDHSPALKSRGNSQFYGLSNERELAITLKVITANGSQKAMHYHDIISPMDYNGDSEIILCTTRLKVVITGRNLDILFDYIIQHRVMWLKEPEESFSLTDDNDAEIEAVRFEDLQ
jgi:hypothetical protein